MNNIKQLELLGLTEKQAKIYESLIISGTATVSTISKNTGLHRPDIYKELPLLQEKGLISNAVRGKLKYYVAESPEKLKQVYEIATKNIGSVIEELATAYSSHSTKPILKFFEGKKGIQQVFSDVVQSLKKGDTFYRYSSSQDKQKAEKYLSADYRAVRDAKQLQRLVIASASKKAAEKPSLDRTTKYVPTDFDLFTYDVTQIIYGKKMAFIDYNSETAVVIENPIIAEFQRKLFLLLWSRL